MKMFLNNPEFIRISYVYFSKGASYFVSQEVDGEKTAASEDATMGTNYAFSTHQHTI